MEREQLVQYLDTAALRARAIESPTTQTKVRALDNQDLMSAVASIAHSLVVIAHVLAEGNINAEVR